MDPLGKTFLPELAAKAPDKKVARRRCFPFLGGKIPIFWCYVSLVLGSLRHCNFHLKKNGSEFSTMKKNKPSTKPIPPVTRWETTRHESQGKDCRAIRSLASVERCGKEYLQLKVAKVCCKEKAHSWFFL